MKNAFEKNVYGGLNALCINYAAFGSEVLASVFDKDKHDLMIGFTYIGGGTDNDKQWGVSLRSVGDKINVYEIAKSRGGGGHFNASGFEVKNFEDIFK